MGLSDLAALERRVACDLAAVEVPARDWVPDRRAEDDSPSSDVVIVGAGLSGLTVAFGLRRKGVTRVRIIDAAPAGSEGPWVTTARMRTLRSPKTLSGLDWGVPALTYRAWHEAVYGPAHFAALDHVTREDWMAYLGWFRSVLGLRVENETRLTTIAQGKHGLALSLSGPDGPETAHCRSLVLATGITGAGGPVVPGPIRSLPADKWTHSNDPLDCGSLRGRDVVVFGAAASAFDWAVAALDAGARRVELVARTAHFPVTEVLDWSNFPGFLEHFGDLDDDWRFAFTDRMLAFRTPPTQEMYDRAFAESRFRFRTAELADARCEDERLVFTFRDGDTLSADHCLLGTGYDVDLHKRCELSSIADDVALWRHRHAPPAGGEHSPVLDYPYLGPAFEFRERVPGTAPHVRSVHLFNNGAVPSLGPVCNGLTGLKYGAPRLVSGLTRRLFLEDAGVHYAALDRFDKRHFDPRNGETGDGERRPA